MSWFYMAIGGKRNSIQNGLDTCSLSEVDSMQFYYFLKSRLGHLCQP